MKLMLYAIWSLLFLGMYFQIGGNPDQLWVYVMVIGSFGCVVMGLFISNIKEEK